MSEPVSPTVPSPELPAPNVDLSPYFDLGGWQAKAFLALVALLLLLWLSRKVRRAIRRRRPPKLNPKLQMYGRNDDAVAAKRRAEAARVLATSSTPTIAGYEIFEQVEAVYVDGFRRPEDALEGLKAVAGMKGANAVTNVRHENKGPGKCSAFGDAVIARRLNSPEEPVPDGQAGNGKAGDEADTLSGGDPELNGDNRAEPD